MRSTVVLVVVNFWSRHFVSGLVAPLLTALFLSSWGCGKVANLSDNSGTPATAAQLDPSPLSAATVDIPYKDLPKVTGGVLPFIFTLSEGALPVGLALAADTGVISGTVPDSEEGKEASFSITITDVNASIDTKAYSIKVNAYTFAVVPEALPVVVPHQPFSVLFDAVGAHGTVAYGFQDALPSGLSFDSKTSKLTATDAVASLDTTISPVTVTLNATDANGVKVMKTYNVVVASTAYVPPALADLDLSAIPVDVPFTTVLTTGGGLPPFTFTVSKGTLPYGLTLTAQSGVISGTVTAASVKNRQGVFSVIVQDAYGMTDEHLYNYGLTPYAIAITPASSSALPQVVPTVPFSMRFAATGAAGAVVFKLSGGLPSGMTFAADGTLATQSSGVAASAASTSWPIEVSATDANGIVGSVDLTLGVTAAIANGSPLAIQTTALLPMVAGTAYSSGISSTGGVAPLAYSLSSGTLPAGLTLSATTGLITGNLASNTAGTTYAIILQVADANGVTQAKTYSGTVTSGGNALAINSTILSTPVAGGDYSSVVAVSGGLPPYVFSVQSGTLTSGLTLASATGVISGTVAGSAAGQPYLFTIAVIDAASQTVAKFYSGTVLSISAPLTIQTVSMVNPVAGAGYTAGISVSGGSSPLVFSIASGSLPTGLSLDASTGLISGSVPYSAAGSGFSVQIKVTDATETAVSRSYVGSVVNGAAAPVIATVTIVKPTAGQAYAQVVEVTGGLTPYAFSLLSGSLPSGLSLSATTGLISGTPAYATAGTSYDIVVKVIDASLQAATHEYSGSVNVISPALTITTASLPTAVAGAAYSAGVSSVGGVSPLVFSVQSGSLPSGLAIDATSGVIAGSLLYSASGTTYGFTVKVTDGAGQTATAFFNGTVASGASTMTIATATLATPAAGQLYAAAIGVSGGVTPYLFSLTAGALPTGLTLSSSTGLITGTASYATAGSSYIFGVTVTDASSQTVAKTYSGTVGSNAALAVATATVSPPTAGSAYQATIAATGGVTPYTFAVTSGALPPGLSLASATGIVSGTPTFASRTLSYAFGVTATDSASHTASQSYSVVVADYALSIFPATLTPPVPGAYYAGSVSAGGGQTPYVYSLLSGTLPSGLSLTSGIGALTGTVADAEAGASRTVVIGVTDANGAATSRTYTISTVSFAITVSTSSLANATEAAPYSNAATSLAATGGSSPYTYSYSGTLPLGVGLTDSGSFFGTPASGQGSLGAGTSYVISVRARDATGVLSAATALTLVVKVSLPTMTAGTLTPGVMGIAYASTLAAAGGRSPYTYALVGSLPGGLALAGATGIIAGTPQAAVACPAGQFAVTATDALSQTSQATVYQCIATSNGIVLSNASLATAYEGAAYSNAATPLAASGGTSPYSYAYTGALPTGVGLTAAGAFFGTPAAGQGSPSGISFPISVLVTDAAGKPSLPVTVTLTTKVSTPAVAGGTPAGAVLGTPYAYTFAAAGGRPGYTYAVSSGSLPAGLSLATSGVVSGTPTAAAACPANQFYIKATDALSQVSAAAAECITTDNGINITSSSSFTVYIGASYSGSASVSGGTSPYTYSAPNLPTGISINASTGLLSGITGVASGDYPVFIVVTDSSATPITTSQSATFHVRSPLVLAASTLPLAAVASGVPIAYTATIAASGGQTPITYLASGSMPIGMSMSSSGVLSGTPINTTPAGSPYALTVTATDAAGTAVTQSYTLKVVVAPVITSGSMPIAVVGVPYALDMKRVGGANPFLSVANTASQLSWSAYFQSGLTGMSINSTSGRISGTPSGTPGTYSVVVGLSDANGFSTSKTLNLALAASPLSTLDLKSARFSEPCLANNTNCSPGAYAIAKLNGTSQQFVVYNRNDTKTIQIARIDATGRIPAASASVYSVNIALPANIGTISSLQIADLDQDGKLDIVFVDTSMKQVCALWNGGTVDVNGMPSGFTAASMNCWVIPTGGDPGNSAYNLVVSGGLRPDSTNYGKADLVVSVSQQGGAANSVAILLNNCAGGGSCTSAAARSTLFAGYIAPTGTVTNASATITGVNSTTGVAVGMPIVGVGIPVGTTVASFVGGTSITMSANATVTTASTQLSLPSAVTTTGTTTTGSAVITAVASTTGVAVGQEVSGAGIPNGTTVASFAANTSITMSVVATSTNAATALIVFGPNLVTPTIISAGSKMYYAYDMGIGYFDAANPLLSAAYATSVHTCPSIVVGGMQQTGNQNSYLYIMRQNFAAGVCQGDFQLHAATDEQSIVPGSQYTLWVDSVLVSDLNNDGISDIAVAMGSNNIASSASVKVFMMPGGATFTGDTVMSPQMQSLNGVNVGASKVITYCLNGAATCSYPALMATCDRAAYFTRNTSYACLSIFPNQCSSPTCTNAFETTTQTQRIDYGAPWGQNREPLLVPLVSTANATPTGTTANGTSSISSVSSLTGVTVGQPLSGAGIPANAYITAASGSTITMSVNATGSATVTLVTPVVPTLSDVVLMGLDTTNTEPFFLVYPRNGSRSVDPLKSDLTLNGFSASYSEAAEIGTLKLIDMNGDGTLDLLAYLVNQGAVAAYMSSTPASPTAGNPTVSLGAALTPNYLDDVANDPTCPPSSSVCLPDPVFNTVGVTQGYPTTVGPYHMQNTMDVMDVNNDGIPDVVVIGYASRDIAVLMGSASGQLSSPVIYDIGSVSDYKPQAVAFVDLDQDGIPDILVAAIDTSGVQTGAFFWLKGNGDGTFQPAAQLTGTNPIPSTCTDPRSIAAVDLVGDGRPEIAVMCYGTQTVWVARRRFDGQWVGQTNATLNPAGGNNGTAMKWGRLTSTVGRDLVVGGGDATNSLRIITAITATVTNASTGAFTVIGTPGSYQSLSGYVSDIEISELAGEGQGDIVVGMQTQNGQNNTNNGNAEIFYTCQTTVAGSCTPKAWGMGGYQTSAVAVGDINGDGLPDIIVGYRANAAAFERMIYRTLTRNLNTSY